jgi:hypothetical protein
MGVEMTDEQNQEESKLPTPEDIRAAVLAASLFGGMVTISGDKIKIETNFDAPVDRTD